jgi:16S rRNA (cytidine1402-2'-O)-methyltransferase
MVSFYSFNSGARTAEIVKKLEEGKQVALVSDSGTPGISDPGYVLIRACIDRNIPVTAVPGPAAAITALVLSGKPTNKFVFEGFLSNKGAKRKKQLSELLKEERTVIIYESPHRIQSFLEDIAELDPEREVAVARELTKKFEEIRRGTAKSHIERFAENKPRGEFIVVL